MSVPYIFASATSNLPLSELDDNFATPITLGSTPIALGDTTASVEDLTLVAPALGSPVSGNFSTGSFTWPTFNQNTTGSAATATTAGNVTGVVAKANGGTGATSLLSAGIPELSASNAFSGSGNTFSSAGNTFALGCSQGLVQTGEIIPVSINTLSPSIQLKLLGNYIVCTSPATGSWTPNITYTSGVTLASALSSFSALGPTQHITVTIAARQGFTAYSPSGLTIDGSFIAVNWVGGAIPFSGNPNSYDVYQYTIIYSSGSFTVIGKFN